jgi:ribonucleoside-diphosphate reductase alpha chain
MKNSELSKYKFQSSYAKYNKDKNRKETWEESVDRVMSMHITHLTNKLGSISDELMQEIDFATQAYKEKLVLGSQRALQFGGDPIMKHNSKMYNCLTSYVDRVDFFGECMYWLLSGCGVGFSVQNKHISNLPLIYKLDNDNVKTFVIEDSIEGWSDAIQVLLSSYFRSGDKFKNYFGHKILFDYSQIRPKGAYISGGFKAPGPDGLRSALIKIEDILENAFKMSNSNECYLQSIEIYDIVMHMSDAVLSGGVRRSATICLFSKEDEKMLNAKTGDWFIKNPQRARSNNSVVLLKNNTSKEEFAQIMKSVKDWGEPGFVWTDDEDIIYNPCVEIGMYPKTENGVSGWQGCNLTEINGKLCSDYKTFARACKASAILGTIQASYTDFKYVTEATKEIFDKEALLGCSITGFMNNPEILLNPGIQKDGAIIIKQTNKKLAEMIGINQAARTTCVKPSGNASVLLDTGSGIHPEHSIKYFRNVQVNKLEEEGNYFKSINPKAVEESVWSVNKTDNIISFPVERNSNTITKEKCTDIELLNYVLLTQQNWVEKGTNIDLCVNKNARHNVSNTINVSNWDLVEEFIYENRKWFAGVSLLSNSGDKDFAQAPFQAVYDSSVILDKYGDGALFASGLIVDGLHAFNNLWTACDQLLYNEKLEESSENVLKIDWLRRANKFAKNYFRGDLLRMTYCLKDVYNNKRWSEINREFKEVNWENVSIEPQYIDIDTLGSIACAGGSCEI